MSANMNGLIGKLRKMKHPEWYEEEDKEDKKNQPDRKSVV